MNELYINIHPLCFGLPSHLGHQGALGRVPCAIQFLLVIYFLHGINNVYTSIPVSQFLPRPLSPLVSIHLFSMSVSLCLYFCSANAIIYTIFLDSTYMCLYMIFVFKILIVTARTNLVPETAFSTVFIFPYLALSNGFLLLVVPHLTHEDTETQGQ